MNNTQLIIDMYKNGVGINKISAILKLSILEIHQYLDNSNIDYRDNKYKDRDNNVCDMYKNNTNITEIANELSINRHTVTDILKRSGIYKGNIRASNDSESKKERNELIIKLYKDGMSMRKVAHEAGVSPGTVNKVLKHFEEEARPVHSKGHSKGTSKNRKYFFDLNFFEVINTEEKAYWLGFLYADGYVSYKGVVQLALQERDVSHLEAFKQYLKTDNVPLIYKDNTKAYSLSLCSVKMSTDLINLGCTQKKSLVLKFPTEEQVPKELIHHFMRGYFDGDGCIYVPNISRNSVFSALGTKEFLDGYEEALLVGIKRDSPNKRTVRENWNENTQGIAYGGKLQVIKIFQYLYKDATIYLERKFNKFNNLLPS